MADGTMTRDEREAFLAEVHVGILAVDEPGRGPLALPIWYQYEDGELFISLDGRSKKADLVRAAGRATLTAQTETPPYRYVSVEGPAQVITDPIDVLALATRYLGPELGQWYADENPNDEHTAVVRITPEHWRTFDFGKALA